MVIDMNEERLASIEALEQFLAGTAGVAPRVCGGEAERQGHVQRVLRRFGYGGLSRAHKGVVVRYLQHTSGYSRQHLVRLIGRFLEHAPLGQRRGPALRRRSAGSSSRAARGSRRTAPAGARCRRSRRAPR